MEKAEKAKMKAEIKIKGAVVDKREIDSAKAYLSGKIPVNTTKPTIVKINDQYYKVTKLG